MTKIINGKEMAQNLRNSLKKEIAELISSPSTHLKRKH
mgnify:CR=1 FL=1